MELFGFIPKSEREKTSKKHKRPIKIEEARRRVEERKNETNKGQKKEREKTKRK